MLEFIYFLVKYAGDFYQIFKLRIGLRAEEARNQNGHVGPDVGMFAIHSSLWTLSHHPIQMHQLFSLLIYVPSVE